MSEIREAANKRILHAARDEFLQHGYARASMRRIALMARMTVGNIYQYYPGKEALFARVVQEPVAQLNILFRLGTAGEAPMHQLVEGLREVFIGCRIPFMILVSHAEGSPYAGYKEKAIQIAQGRLMETLDARFARRLAGPLAVSLIEGLLYLFNQSDGDAGALTTDLQAYLQYMLHGVVPAPSLEA